MKIMTLKQEYMSIYSQCYSPGCNFLAAGNNHGEVAVFDFAFQPSDELNNHPRITYQTAMQNVYALTSTKKFLIAAGDGPLTVLPWEQLYPKKRRRYDDEDDEDEGGEDDEDKKRRKKKKKKDDDDEDMEDDDDHRRRRRRRRRDEDEDDEELKFATVDVLSRSTSEGEPYINALAPSPVSSHAVYCARSDGVVIGVDVGRGAMKSHLTFHAPQSSANSEQKAEIISLAARCQEGSSALVGGTSDGRVIVWDVRAGSKPRFCLEPGPEVEAKSTIGRKFQTGGGPGKDYMTHGHFVSAVDIRGDWLVCGGSMDASLWDMGTRQLATVFESDKAPHPIQSVAIASEPKMKASKKDRGSPGLGQVIVGGKGPNVAIFTPEGEVKAVIPTGNSWNYSLKCGRLKDSFPLVLTTAGTSNKIGVFSNLMYPAFEYDF